MAEQLVEWSLQIEGMTCDHCASTLDLALRRVPGVAEAATSYPAGTARVVASSRVDAATLEQAVSGSGYRVAASSARPIGSARQSAPPDRPDYALAIVGTGSAGVAAAIRAAELGATVAIIERGTLGGTCVNIGCVPSKTLIRAAEVVHRATHHGFAGVRTRVDGVDFGAIVAQKDQLVAELRQTKYADVLAGYPSITLLRGAARFGTDGMLEVDGTPVRAGKYLLASGASPWAPPIPGLSDTQFLTSTEALALQTLPASLVVVGGSAVGLEIAQLYARLGTRVTVLEAQASLVPAEDAEIAAALTGYLRAEGIAIETGAAIQHVTGEPGRYLIQTTLANGPRTFEVEQLLVATGRRPNTRGMGLDEAGIQLGTKGEVVVNELLETTRPGVYAAGDTIGDPAFVYVAAYAGSLAAENALGTSARRYDLSVVPRVTFTDPAIASVGLTEVQARARGIDVAVSRLPMSYVPRAIAARDTRGMIKLVADRTTNLMVGAHILAPEAGDLIQEAVMAIQFGIRVDQITTMLHPYLTNAEAMKLACQTFDKDVAKLSCCA